MIKQAYIAGQKLAADNVGVAAIFHNGKMLIGRRRDNKKWTQPGGHIDAGESPIAGTVREIKEEAGITVKPSQLKHLKSEVVTKAGGKKLNIHAYRVDLKTKPKVHTANDPDQEITGNWQWKKPYADTKINNNLHVPMSENVLLKGLLEKTALSPQLLSRASKKAIQQKYTARDALGAIGTRLGTGPVAEKVTKPLEDLYTKRKVQGDKFWNEAVRRNNKG